MSYKLLLYRLCTHKRMTCVSSWFPSTSSLHNSRTASCATCCTPTLAWVAKSACSKSNREMDVLPGLRLWVAVIWKPNSQQLKMTTTSQPWIELKSFRGGGKRPSTHKTQNIQPMMVSWDHLQRHVEKKKMLAIIRDVHTAQCMMICHPFGFFATVDRHLGIALVSLIHNSELEEKCGSVATYKTLLANSNLSKSYTSENQNTGERGWWFSKNMQKWWTPLALLMKSSVPNGRKWLLQVLPAMLQESLSSLVLLRPFHKGCAFGSHKRNNHRSSICFGQNWPNLNRICISFESLCHILSPVYQLWIFWPQSNLEFILQLFFSIHP